MMRRPPSPAATLLCVLLAGWALPGVAHARGSALPIPFLSLPKLADWGKRPSELFLVPSSQLDRVAKLRPYGGRRAGSCRQPYGSFELQASTSLITPVDGKVTEVTYCGREGARDGFGVAIRFARHDGSPVELVLQAYPSNTDRKLTCSEGRARFDNGLFASWLGVQEGRSVEAGAPLAKSDASLEVRFFLRDPEKGRISCPNVFAPDVVRPLLGNAPASPCLAPTTSPLCLETDPGENWLYGPRPL